MGLLIQRVCDELVSALSAGTRCLVHCAAGMSRSVSLCAAYLIRREGMTMKDAILRIRERRPCANPNPSFRHQLLRWQRECGKERTC